MNIQSDTTKALLSEQSQPLNSQASSIVFGTFSGLVDKFDRESRLDRSESDIALSSMQHPILSSGIVGEKMVEQSKTSPSSIMPSLTVVNQDGLTGLSSDVYPIQLNAELKAQVPHSVSQLSSTSVSLDNLSLPFYGAASANQPPSSGAEVESESGPMTMIHGSNGLASFLLTPGQLDRLQVSSEYTPMSEPLEIKHNGTELGAQGHNAQLAAHSAHDSLRSGHDLLSSLLGSQAADMMPIKQVARDLYIDDRRNMKQADQIAAAVVRAVDSAKPGSANTITPLSVRYDANSFANSLDASNLVRSSITTDPNVDQINNGLRNAEATLQASPNSSVAKMSHLESSLDAMKLNQQLKLAIDNVVAKLPQRSAEGLRINLTPEALGRLEIQVKGDGDRVTILFNVSNSSSREIMLSQLDRFRAQLGENLSTGISVSVDSRGEHTHQRDKNPTRQEAHRSFNEISDSEAPEENYLVSQWTLAKV
ncbi:flagellar hook-length control protein FliK [uncultured Umboniibacter sp.]|uniref:flagellar hook-length control protein FliK n=1 Tax=uncultured Umboniibacter sp. TaxID=1798917 RepID=UPI002605D866|nr:flagellar hook-length control protein FliK [uncultured Umboniibacter sp.]